MDKLRISHIPPVSNTPLRLKIHSGGQTFSLLCPALEAGVEAANEDGERFDEWLNDLIERAVIERRKAGNCTRYFALTALRIESDRIVRRERGRP